MTAYAPDLTPNAYGLDGRRDFSVLMVCTRHFPPFYSTRKTCRGRLHMRRLHERLSLAKTVLHELRRSALGRTELEKRTVRKSGTHATFEGIFSYLVQNGYVQKSEQRHRAPYVITEKGVKLLEGL
jgi:predicted transcriptional regulator